MVSVTFFLIDIELRSGVELFTYLIFKWKYTYRLLGFNPFTNKYSVGSGSLMNIITNVFAGILNILLILIALARLLMPFGVELMIIVQIFQVSKTDASV